MIRCIVSTLHEWLAVAVLNTQGGCWCCHECSSCCKYRSVCVCVLCICVCAAGVTSANNDRVNLVVTIQEGESEQVGNEAPHIPNGDTDSTGTLKEQVSEFSALQMRSNKEQMPALPNCKEVSPLSHLSVPLLQNALGQRYKKQLVCRMRGRKERREVYSEIDLKSTQSTLHSNHCSSQ